MSHAGYEQVAARREAACPGKEPRSSAGSSPSTLQASDLLLRKAFSPKEAARLSTLSRSQKGVEPAAAPATIKG